MTTCTDQMMLYKLSILKVQASYTYYAHFGVIIFRETAVLFVPSFVCFAAVSLFWVNSVERHVIYDQALIGQLQVKCRLYVPVQVFKRLWRLIEQV